jgi:hypothetical protein
MNNYEESLKFTMEKMVNNKLNFLDTTTYLDQFNVPQLKHFRKPTASDVIYNFEENICPKKYKISTLVGEIHRCNNTTTTENDLDDALKNTKKLFTFNGYPENLIDKKINEIKKSQFLPSNKRNERKS